MRVGMSRRSAMRMRMLCVTHLRWMRNAYQTHLNWMLTAMRKACWTQCRKGQGQGQGRKKTYTVGSMNSGRRIRAEGVTPIPNIRHAKPGGPRSRAGPILATSSRRHGDTPKRFLARNRVTSARQNLASPATLAGLPRQRRRSSQRRGRPAEGLPGNRYVVAQLGGPVRSGETDQQRRQTTGKAARRRRRSRP